MLLLLINLKFNGKINDFFSDDNGEYIVVKRDGTFISGKDFLKEMKEND